MTDSEKKKPKQTKILDYLHTKNSNKTGANTTFKICTIYITFQI